MTDSLARNSVVHAPSVVMLTPDRQIDRRILLQANSLEKTGWHVTIVAMKSDLNPVWDDSRVVRVGSGGTKWARENLVANGYRWLTKRLPMNGRLMRALRSFAWRFLADQETFHFRLFYDTALRCSPDVFVAHDLPMLPVAKQVATKRNAKLVYDSHELYSEQEFSEREKRRWAEIEAKYIGVCDAVITVNQSIAAELERRYGIDDIRVIYNAERCTDTPLRIRLFHEVFGLAADKKILLFQGGLSAGRNLEVLVDAMRHMQNTSVVLVILGDGFLLKKLQVKVKSKMLSSRVYFHPAVPQKELLTFTAAADAGVIPYQATCLNNYFCTPNKLYEFIAAGIPILASDLPEIKNMVFGQKIGLVGDMSTTEKLAGLVDEFFENEQRLTTWRENVAMVRKRVCWEEEEKKLVKIYEALR